MVFLDAVVGMVHRGLGVWVNLARFVWCDADRCLGYCLCCAADWWMFWLCTAVHGGLRGQENMVLFFCGGAGEPTLDPSFWVGQFLQIALLRVEDAGTALLFGLERVAWFEWC